MNKIITVLFLLLFTSSVFAAKLYVGGEKYEKDGVNKTILSLKVNSFSFGAKPVNAQTNNIPNPDLDDEIPF